MWQYGSAGFQFSVGIESSDPSSFEHPVETARSRSLEKVIPDGIRSRLCRSTAGNWIPKTYLLKYQLTYCEAVEVSLFTDDLLSNRLRLKVPRHFIQSVCAEVGIDYLTSGETRPLEFRKSLIVFR